MTSPTVPRLVTAEAFITEPVQGVTRERWLYCIQADDLVLLGIPGRHIFLSPLAAERFTIADVQAHRDPRENRLDITITTSDGEYLTMPCDGPLWLTADPDDRGSIILQDPGTDIHLQSGAVVHVTSTHAYEDLPDGSRRFVSPPSPEG
jgi:hypothetical protein